MFGCFFKRYSTEGSANQAFESASARSSFFAALLLLIDTVIAVSIFVCTDNLVALVFLPVCAFILRVLLKDSRPTRSKPLAA